MVDSQNLLVNHGFENDMEGYSAWGGTDPATNQIISDDVAEGEKALKVSGDGFQGSMLPLIPGAEYTFRAWGKTGGENTGATAWITLNAPGSTTTGDNSLEFAETEWTEKSLTLRNPNVTQAKATAWKDPNPEFLYCDDIRLTVRQTEAGTQYYCSAQTAPAPAPAIGESKPAEYNTLLVSGDNLPRDYGSYLNVVEVDAEGKVTGFASLPVEIGEKKSYSITVTGGTAQPETAMPGDTVTVTADAPPEGMSFAGWTSDTDVTFADAMAVKTTFTMPASPVSMSANYAYPTGTTFYVDSEGGDDSSEGTSADAPWKTLGKVNALTLKPGDRVLLKAGSVFEGQSLSLRGSGSGESPIVVDMYDGDTVGAQAGARPVIHANGVAKADFVIGREGDTGTTSRPGVAYGLHIKNMSHIRVSNLEITNTTGTRQMAVGVVVEAESGRGVVSGVHLDGLYVHDVYGTLTEKTAPNGGIYIITTAANGDVAHATRYDDVSVENCTVANVSRTGISVGSSHSAYYWERHPGGVIPEEVKAKYGHTNVVIRNNYVEESGGDAIVPQFCIAPLIEYNVSSGASQNTKDDYGAMYNAAIWPWRCEDALFQFNEAYGTVNNGDGQAYDCDSSRGTTYQYNYSHDNEGGFMLLCQSQSIESTVRYNISQNDHDSLFLVSNTTPAEIYNNTFYIGENLTKIVDGGSPSHLKNNIFYNNSGKPDLAGWGNFTYDNNLYYGFDSVPGDANKIVADPMFTDAGKGGSGVEGDSAIDTLGGYALREGSPAINAGLPIAGSGGRDYAGNAILGYPDLGAMESGVEGDNTVELWTTNSYVNPFQDFKKTSTPMAGETIDLLMAQNDRESAQILLRSDEDFTISGVEFSSLSDGSNTIDSANIEYNFVDYHNMRNSSGQNASTAIRWGEGGYPDRLSSDPTRTVTAGNTQSIWITVYAPAGTVPGIYTGAAAVKTDKGDFSVTVTAEVVDAEIPSASESVFELSYWQNISGTWNWSGIDPDMYILSGLFPEIKAAGKWSQPWWDYVESAADAMEEARVNVLHVQPLELLMDGGTTVTGYGTEDVEYHFDWSKFDEYIEYFMDRGFIKKLELYHLLNTKYASHTEPTILIPDPAYDANAGFSYTNRPLKVWEVPSYFSPADGDQMAPEVEAFYRQYIPALTDHLYKKGWTDISFQHVEDECISARERKEYLHMVKMFNELVPQEKMILFGDPIDTNNVDFMLEETTMQFPLSSIFDGSREKYAQWIAQNPGTVMMYTCLNPQGDYLNKYIDKPVWQMRVQSWYSYAVDVTGHLHWAWDAGWADAWTDGGANIGVNKTENLNLFNWKGDDFIVWPDIENNGVESSIRAASIRDGAEDYEVFHLLAQRGEDYETWVKEQIGSVVQSNSSYTKDIEVMMAIREQIYRVVNGEMDIYSTVTFDGNGGDPGTTPVKAVTGAVMGSKMPEAPVRPGYLFTGWNTRQDGSGKAFTAETPVTANVTVYAQWISGNDMLSFAVNGTAAVVDAESHTVTARMAHGTDLTALAPVFTLSDGAACTPASGAAADFTAPVAYTVTAGDGTAQVWTVTITAAAADDDNAAVTFEENGGEPALAGLTVAKGSLLAQPEHSMTIVNKVFTGWYKDAGLTQAWDFAADTVTEDITLYAKWVDEFYYSDFTDETGTWRAADGSAFTAATLINDEGAQDGKAVYLPAVAQKHRAVSLLDAGKLTNGTIEMRVKVTGSGEEPILGLSFRSPAENGYYNAAALRASRFDNRLLADSSGNHHAPGTESWADPWTDKTFALKGGKYYDVTFRFYDQAITIIVDGEVVLSGDTSWTGWSTNEGYVGIYGWGPNTNYTIDHIKVTPARTPAQMELTLDLQDGGTPEKSTVTEGSLVKKPADPVRAGHEFLGWTRDADGAKAWNFETDKVYANLTLYAQWRALSGDNAITSFVFQGFEDCPGTIDAVNHTVSVVLPAGTDLKNPLSPAIGLHEKADVKPQNGFGVTFESGVARDYTVTAENGDIQVWKVTVTVMAEGSHRITWHANGGAPVPTQTAVGAGESIAAPAAMTRSGYTFGGWYLDETFETEAVFPIAGVTADVNLYAKWTGEAQAAYVFMSDTHVTGAGDGARLNYAFNAIDKLLPGGYDGLIIAGDMVSDGAGDSQMKYVQDILDAYNPQGADKYVVRGNHDRTDAMETLSEEYYPASYYHVEMGGYHFLMCDSNDFGSAQQSWLSGELAKLKSSEGYDPGEPIFVVMHAPLSGTVLGSGQSFGSSAAVYGILRDYPQAVVLTGHSHRDLYDDRAIHQKDFTSVHLGGMQYIEFDGGRIEGSVPAQTGLVHEDGSQSQMNQAVIATVYSDRLAFDRYDFSVDRHLGTWEVALPLTRDSFTYTEDNRDKESPAFPQDAEITYNMISSGEVEFTYPQAEDNAYVYDYQVELKKDGQSVSSFLTFSQFYAAQIPARKTNRFAGLEPETEYTLEITARDALGNACAEKLTSTFSTTAAGALGSVSCANPSFDLDDAGDVTVDVTSENVPLHSLRFGDTALTPGQDYVITGNKAVIFREYFRQFGAGATVTLDFVFAQGDPTELAIAVTGSSHTVKTARRDFEDGDLSGFETYRQDYTISMNTDSPLKGEKSLQVTTGANGKQMLLDASLPPVQDGILEFDVRPVGADFGAMAFIIRGTDDNHHLAIGCDGTGDWLWINMNGGAETYALVANDSVPLLAGETYHIKMSFYGDHYELYVDDTCVIRTVVPGLTDQPGYVGIHNWGSSARGVVIDDVTLTYAEKNGQPPEPVDAQTPAITAQPADISVTPGGAAVLSVSAAVSDGGTLSYQWYSSTQDSAQGGTPIAGATDAHYSAPTAFEGTGYYYVVVTNTNGGATGEKTASIASDTAEVIVTAAPSAVPGITRYPIKAGAGEGGSISPAGTVRVERNADKTFTVKADEGYVISDVLVDGTSVGAVERYTFEKVTRAHTITAEFRKTNSETETGFTDVAGDAWYAGAVAYVTEAGLFNGVGGGRFAPMDSMTRAMFFTVLHRMSGEDTGEAGETWYSSAMEWAMALGITDGTAPEADITREQLAVMLYRYAGAEKTRADLSGFTDAGSISGWAVEAMHWAVAEGVITGKSGGMLDPSGPATRAEVAAMLERLIR
nr:MULTISPECIES: InlB B-repeat-containing protein [unclassified Pseudoflavonifractor]